MWAVVDSNHRSRKTADLQSAPFGRSGNCPYISIKKLLIDVILLTNAIIKFQTCRASGGIRTPDQLITNQLLWPTELHWQLPNFSVNELPKSTYHCIAIFLGRQR